MNQNLQKLLNEVIKLISKKNKTIANWVKLVPIALAAFGIAVPTIFNTNFSHDDSFPTIPVKTCSAKIIDKSKIKTYKNCTVQKVYDGDTVTLECGRNGIKKVRMVGIDAPEMQQEPWGKKSRQALIKFLGTEKVDLAEESTDMYARSLGVLFVKQENANLFMVKNGFAVAYDNRSTAREYCNAETNARNQSLGIWSTKGWHQDPKGWRKHKKEDS